MHTHETPNVQLVIEARGDFFAYSFFPTFLAQTTEVANETAEELGFHILGQLDNVLHTLYVSLTEVCSLLRAR